MSQRTCVRRGRTPPSCGLRLGRGREKGVGVVAKAGANDGLGLGACHPLGDIGGGLGGEVGLEPGLELVRGRAVPVGRRDRVRAVSYTHLTLPTIYSV